MIKRLRIKFLLISIVVIFICYSGIAGANDSRIKGSWLLTRVIENNSVIKPFVSVKFDENGRFFSMGIPAGTWKYYKKSKLIVIKSLKLKKLNGNNNVLKITKDELALDNSGIRMDFIKLDQEKIAKGNSLSGLEGTWIYQDRANPDIVRVLIFKEPDIVKEIQKEPGVESRNGGSWIFNEEGRAFYLLGRFEDIRGKNRVLELSNEKITFENKGKIYKFKKETQNTYKVERLNFTDDDFFNKEGEYKYKNNRDKLPWLDPYETIEYLKNVHELEYRFSTLINGTQVFINKTITAYVKADPKKESVDIDYIFNGYDRNNLPEDAELPSNKINPYQNTNSLYPEREGLFRVKGKDTITTPAGVFKCTVIEAAGDIDTVKKLWMIDGKPGVYAKIIVDDNSPDFPHYSVYELQKIK